MLKMANIQPYIDEIEAAARGEQVRDAIVNALMGINVEGVDNALTLGGHSDVYFATREQMNLVKTGLTPRAAIVEIYPQDWDSDGNYSFEDTYPSSKYNVYIQPGPHTTEAQLKAISKAGIVVGDQNLNVIRCVGIVPTINVEFLAMVVSKS
jgi:hypothetical protein